MGPDDAPLNSLPYYLGVSVMTKFERWWRSFKKNVIQKRKFKAYLQYFFDSEYRSQIDRLFELTKHCTRKEYEQIPIWQLEHGHKITYPKYERALILNDEIDLEPIRVIQNGIVFVVVDGNHRLAALRSRAKKYGTQFVLCEVLK